MEATLLDLFPTIHDRSHDGYSIAKGQGNDTDTREGIEGRGGPEIDETEQKLDDHAEHHSVERHVELRVNLFPPAGRPR